MNGGDAGEVGSTQSATEGESMELNVSLSEETKGGMKYEVLLEEPKVETPRLRSPSKTSSRPLSAEILQLKIAAAADRRKSLETLRVASLSERFRKVQEVAKKHQEDLVNLANATKENLDQKIEVTSAKRETLITDIKTKLNNHSNHLQEVRENLIQNEEKAKEEILNKLEAAEKNRERLIQEKLESLKKHDEKVEMIRTKKSSIVVTEEEMPSVTDESPQQ